MSYILFLLSKKRRRRPGIILQLILPDLWLACHATVRTIALVITFCLVVVITSHMLKCLAIHTAVQQIICTVPAAQGSFSTQGSCSRHRRHRESKSLFFGQTSHTSPLPYILRSLGTLLLQAPRNASKVVTFVFASAACRSGFPTIAAHHASVT